MKGLVKLTPESALQLSKECVEYMQDFDIEPYKTTEHVFNLFKMRKSKRVIYNGLPFWHQYKNGLIRHMSELRLMAENAKKHNDEVWLSELSYKNMVLLKDGDEHANAVYILNY